MADLEQINRQLVMIRKKKDIQDKKIEQIRITLEKELKIREGFQEQIDKLTGNVEEDGGMTTTSMGDIAVAGGQGNYAPKMGMKSRNGFTKYSMFNKKKKNESTVIDYLDGLFE